MGISSEGRIGIALALVFGLGAGAIIVWPYEKWIGWATMVFSASGLIALAIHHLRTRQAAIVLASPRVVSGAAAAARTLKSHEPRRDMSAVEMQFTKGRGWYSFWAGAPFNSSQAKRRVEFIDAWTSYFSKPLPEIETDRRGFAVRTVIDFVLGESPDAVQRLLHTPEHLEKKILARLTPEQRQQVGL